MSATYIGQRSTFLKELALAANEGGLSVLNKYYKDLATGRALDSKYLDDFAASLNATTNRTGYVIFGTDGSDRSGLTGGDNNDFIFSGIGTGSVEDARNGADDINHALTMATCLARAA